MSDVQKNILSRRSVYRFKEKSVEKSALETAFEAARHAPCHKQTHPWKFFIMGEQSRNSIIQEVENLARKKAAGSENESVELAIERAINKILKPPVLIAVSSVLSPDDPFREKEDYAASVCAIHNLVLSLWDQGIGSQWSTGAITRSAKIYETLGINREEEEIIGLIKAGYPSITPERKKKSLDETRVYLD